MLEDLASADAAVVPCLDASVWALPEADLIAAVDAVHLLEQRVAAVKLALVREVDGRGVVAAQGAASTAVWLRERLHMSIQAGHRLVALAARWTPVRRCSVTPWPPARSPWSRPR